MELRAPTTPPTDAERDAIELVLGPAPANDLHSAVGGHHLRAHRHLLLPTLHALNDRVGSISPAAVDHLAQRLDVSPAEVFGVVSFYALFSTDQRPAHQVHTCVDLACLAAGGPRPDQLPPQHNASPCLGLCERAPASLVIEHGPDHSAAASPAAAPEAAAPQAGDPSLVLLRRVGRGDPTDLEAYLADRGFQALDRARTIGADEVIAAIDQAGLTGRGGAGFPTARKWTAVAGQTATPHYLICNADESEPGTFKDRTLIENDPYALIEAMCIAAFATGCSHGYIYLRGEYPRAHTTLERALEACRQRGLIGPDSTDGFDIEVRRGAGAYICGEETAICNSIEGYRGEPRNKPPYPFEHGLFGKPTLINNVETLINVPPIVLDGGLANRRLFCLSGAVARPGVYEAELGLTLGALIDLAGGIRAEVELQAILLGGAAGGFVGPDDLGLVLDDASTRAAGLTLGSGVVLVLDHTVDLVDQLVRIAEFFAEESCGQCVPCRVGTQRQHEATERLRANPNEADLALIGDIGKVMRDASICGLGQTASSAIESAIKRLDTWR